MCQFQQQENWFLGILYNGLNHNQMGHKSLVKNIYKANSIGNSQFGPDKDILFVDAFYFRL